MSEAPFDTLNLGRLTDDDPERVRENRRRLCAEVGTDAGAPALRQAGARRRRPPRRGSSASRATASGSDSPGEPLLVFTADCLPSRSCGRTASRPRRPRSTSAGAACSPGSSQSGASALGGTLAAAIGPGIGPCCYEVGEEVAAPFRERFGDEVVRDGRLDLWTAAERALRAAGVEDVHRTDLCTCCNPELFFSHRRDDGRTGRQGMIAYVC